MKVAIFGSGEIGLVAYKDIKKRGDEVVCFIDNNEKLHGTKMEGIGIISLEDYKNSGALYPVIIATRYHYQAEIEKQLLENGISRYTNYRRERKIKRLFSNCSKEDLEDVILYHLLKDDANIFFIDVGSNDPVLGSVTKMLVDMKGATGINIEPQKDLYEISCKERRNDINLCTGVGSKEDDVILYFQEGGSTICPENVILQQCEIEEIHITTLEKICDIYVNDGQNISFLKIDVEGAEREVLLGANFDKYRPDIICMEATLPRTQIPCHDKWEDILVQAGYKYKYTKGINRYYVSSEKEEKYKKEFSELDDLEDIYDIYIIKTQRV